MTRASEVYIQATATDPAVSAQADVSLVQERLRSKLSSLTRPALDADGAHAVRSALTGFCTGELRPHLAATDETLYAAASGAAETRLLVQALRAASAALQRQVDALSAAEDDASALAVAQQAEAVLGVHFTVERTVLLPALAALPGADLPSLVADLHTLLSGGALERPAVIDVREIPHGRRHPRIFACYARLAPGEAFTLVNNHDPRPLRREFEAAYPGAYSWDYVESGPEVWRVRIGRAAVDA
ncbi:DUF2249 domain-containing protein [Streptomyces sp. N2-109]|uniref:DUF2249 domain-containing protein n=1 Tax=Streptomyces gossypii TaxID=2883101 RepID=A0ABT2JMA1_9ACTN|nr:DUF2249 domain-containing protein [Streptomyces gossypii]MCT2588649.1 DUF2249 domain-containing protein [Streptomyces gossypii]